MANHDSNWSELHEDLLRMIMKELSIFDIVRFSAVCSHWQSATEPISPRAFLAVSDSHVVNIENDDKKPILNLLYLNPKIPSIRDIEEEDNYFIGSSKSMLILLDKKTSSMPVVFNPFSLKIHRFPPLRLPFLKNNKKEKRLKTVLNEVYFRLFSEFDNVITKAIVVPLSPTSLALVVIHGRNDTKGLAYCVITDDHDDYIAWVPLSGGSFYDVVSSSETKTGDKVIYAISSPSGSGSVESWVLRTARRHRPGFVPSRYSPLQVLPHRCLFERRYLAVGPGPGGDELYLVTRVGIGRGFTQFRLYRADYNSSSSWGEVKDFSGTVFVGASETRLVMCSDTAKDYPARGCVYFTDDEFCRNRRGYEVGVFSLEKMTHVVDCFCDKLHPNYLDSLPFWFVPN